MAKSADITSAQIRAILDYNPETGEFRWRFRRDRSAQWNSHHSGNIAGSLDQRKYVRIGIGARSFKAHRLAWLYVHGEWPRGEIDHINGVCSDNKIENLRECSHGENHQNRSKHAGNKAGFMGVFRSSTSDKWCAQISVNGKQRHLGVFDTPRLAHEAYLGAKSRLHTFQPSPRGT